MGPPGLIGYESPVPVRQSFAPPLILYSDGTVHPIIANKDSLQYMKLVRKYPNRGESDYWYSAFIDSHFEAADNPDFKSPHSICTIRHKPDYRYQFIPDRRVRLF